MKKITEKFENGVLVERITEETPDPVKPATTLNMPYSGGWFTSTPVRDYLGNYGAR